MVEFVISNSLPPMDGVKSEISKKTDAREDADKTLRETEASCDTPKKPLAFYLTFTGLIVAIFLYSLDATTLAVAIPYIAEDLGGSTLESFWASMSYILLVVLTQPLYTTFSDIFGRKPLLLAAFFFFGVGSLTFALAQNMTTIVAGRALQGLGGGGLNVLSDIIVADMTTLEERSKYLGIMVLPIATGTLLGPFIGAWFTEFATWRWIGWVNLPLVGVAFPLVFFFLRLRTLEASFLTKLKSVDWGGVGLFAVGCVSFVLSLSWAGNLHVWGSWRTILPLIIGAMILAIFAIYESRPANPIVPHRLFHSTTAIATLCGAFINGMIMFTLLQWLPLLYQSVMLQTLISSSLSQLPASIASIVAAIISLVAVGKIGKGYLMSLRVAWILMTIGSGLLILFDADSSAGMRYGLPIIYGAGIGALLRAIQLPMQASVPTVDDTGLAIGLMLSFRLLGGLVGQSIGSAIFSSVFASSIKDIGVLPSSLMSLHANNAIGFIPKLRMLDLSSETLAPVLDAYLNSIRAIFYTTTALGALGLFSSFFTKELSLQNSDLGRQRFEK
ncbi:MFS transporter [Sclerotinia borealis F-4128]|uniref:MFS transporter n=1 Tax=Sclerotinia borealis (strain F-4128) TaxID=1432307 RepID=W9CQD5_SCLBF|nr:MFS transporter [Sclerotinia borealis F-4128]